MEKGRKRNSVQMQPRKVKIKINLKATWGPFSPSLGAPGKYPLLPSPLGGPEQIGWMEVIKQCMVRRGRPDGPQEGCPVIYADSQKEGSVPVHYATVQASR